MSDYTNGSADEGFLELPAEEVEAEEDFDPSELGGGFGGDGTGDDDDDM